MRPMLGVLNTIESRRIELVVIGMADDEHFWCVRRGGRVQQHRISAVDVERGLPDEWHFNEWRTDGDEVVYES